jgi:hypothetical protein
MWTVYKWCPSTRNSRSLHSLLVVLPFTLQENVLLNLYCNAAPSLVKTFPMLFPRGAEVCFVDYMTMSPSSIRSTYKRTMCTENKETTYEEHTVRGQNQNLCY